MPAIKNVASGSVTYTAGSGTNPADIEVGTSVDFPLGQSIVCFTELNGDFENRVKRHTWTSQLLTDGSNTDLSFSRSEASDAKSVTLEWTVFAFESSALSEDVITGEIDCTNTVEDVALGSVVDEAATLVFVDSKTSHTGWHEGDFVYTTELTTITTARDQITFTHNSTPVAGESVIRFQVIEFQTADIVVQHGTTSYGKVGTTTSISGFTTLGNMFVLSTGLRPGSTTTMRWFTRVQINSTTEIEFDPHNTGSSITGFMSWSVAEPLDGGAVESGTITISDTDATPSPQPSFGALTANRTGVIVGTMIANSHATSGSTNLPDDIFFSASLDVGRDGVTLTRSGTDLDIEVGWAVVEWAVAAVAVGSVVRSPVRAMAHLLRR